jgi:hypothetical protein
VWGRGGRAVQGREGRAGEGVEAGVPWHLAQGVEMVVAPGEVAMGMVEGMAGAGVGWRAGVG